MDNFNIRSLIIANCDSIARFNMSTLNSDWHNYMNKHISQYITEILVTGDLFSLNKRSDDWLHETDAAYVFGIGNIEILAKYINIHPNLNRTRALIGAGLRGCWPVIKLLKPGNDRDRSALLAGACQSENVELVKFLLECGVDSYAHAFHHLMESKNMIILSLLANHSEYMYMRDQLIYMIDFDYGIEVYQSYINGFAWAGSIVTDLCIAALCIAEKFSHAEHFIRIYGISNIDLCVGTCSVYKSLPGMKYLLRNRQINRQMMKLIGDCDSCELVDWVIIQYPESIYHIVKGVIHDDNIKMLDYLISRNAPGLLNVAMRAAQKYNSKAMIEYISGLDTFWHEHLYLACFCGNSAFD